MHRFALALLLASALAMPALAQTKEEPKKDAAKVVVPTNTFFKGQTASQYLAGEQLIGAKSVEQAVEIQSQYAKKAYDTYMAEMSKIGEMYAGLARDAYKPVETAFTKKVS